MLSFRVVKDNIFTLNFTFYSTVVVKNMVGLVCNVIGIMDTHFMLLS